MKKQQFLRILLVGAGSAALLLGAIGVFIPILPTTPFLLLTAFCYLRGSSRLHSWLIGNRLFGPFIYNYTTNKAITRKTKIFSGVLVWLSLMVSILFVTNLYVRLLLIAVGVGVTIHLLVLKTMPVNSNKDDGR